MLDQCIADAIKTCARAIGTAVVDGRTTCVHCAYFDLQSEKCYLAQPPARPPAKVIAFGCASFTPIVPF